MDDRLGTRGRELGTDGRTGAGGMGRASNGRPAGDQGKGISHTGFESKHRGAFCLSMMKYPFALVVLACGFSVVITSVRTHRALQTTVPATSTASPKDSAWQMPPQKSRSRPNTGNKSIVVQPARHSVRQALDETAVRQQLAAEGVWDSSYLTPQIVWLASYPNSGTSYTMTMVQRATNLSVATNYGAEVTYQREDSLPIYPQHAEGPFWRGLSGKLGIIRELPSKYVLVKTHCGGRCIKCTSDDYVVDLLQFVKACQRTSGRLHGNRFDRQVPTSAVRKTIHIIRNPLHNSVARFHLDRKNMAKKNPLFAALYPVNVTGFTRWCQHLDQNYNAADYRVFDKATRQLFQSVPCYSEFYKWTAWHNRVNQMVKYLGGTNLLTVYYEDYMYQLNATANRIFDFLEQKPLLPLRPFRDLPHYELDHFTTSQASSIVKLIRHLATEPTWEQIRHYFQ